MHYNQLKPELSDIAHLVALLSQFYPVSPELAEEFQKHAFSIQLKNGEHILHEGGICKNMYFIKQGAMMAYSEYHHKRITTYISMENEFVSSLSGLYGQEASREAIMAIEPSTLLGVDTDILLGWYQRFFELNFIIRQVYENYYRDAQERSFIVRVGNAKERYMYFLKSRSEAAARLPVACVASFLDMKPETLIRLKKHSQNELHVDVLQLIKQIDDYVIATEAFKMRSITLKVLAIALNVPGHEISRCLKIHYKLAFTHYINRHRIMYFKHILKVQKLRQTFTIEAIAQESGFMSRSGFYKAFKKFEGISPTEYCELIHRNPTSMG